MKHQKYHIKKIDSIDVSVVVYSVSYDSPMNYLASIERDLASNGVRGKVCFDLLLSNGNNSDRFYCAIFDGERISATTLKREINVSDEIHESSLMFYSEKEELLANSVLNRAQRFMVKKKIKLKNS